MKSSNRENKLFTVDTTRVAWLTFMGKKDWIIISTSQYEGGSMSWIND